ncbi:hypothetical protein RLO149_c021390 [Roseobacter litoralis Och 149]|uniref:Uncharacterized protein n=1 Tax=Roseobacter litoralis (strain ATCC 49566 / DSM 6996 / JCM 21268 / NBRC 15278 / OCh 149) TaxID=391595 RepID=F7ZLR4_ROSLO|nr:hypothetical protein RLO149_c021390 [Roseobacter litoralis Och 149]
MVSRKLSAAMLAQQSKITAERLEWLRLQDRGGIEQHDRVPRCYSSRLSGDLAKSCGLMSFGRFRRPRIARKGTISPDMMPDGRRVVSPFSWLRFQS